MTQEELDALMNGDMDLDSEEESAKEEKVDLETPTQNPEDMDKINEEGMYPLPATPDHQIVSQLDDVTKESEEKAGEIMDVMDEVSNSMMDNEEKLNSVLEILKVQKELLEELHKNFPQINKFKENLDKIEEAISLVNEGLENSQNAGDNMMLAMDIMQFQDIHRQKIERVINIMRSLITYMNKLFEGKIEDSKRVSSAKHLHGDTETKDVVEVDDIEALLDQFGKK